MSSFKINSDDLAVRGLLESNKSPAVSSPIMPVKASTPVQKSPEHIPLEAEQKDRRSTNTQQRRQDDRRKAESNVLLDTRNQHERRAKTGRDTDTEINATRGIDETV